MPNLDLAAPTHAPGCLSPAPAGKLFLERDHHEFQRRIKSNGRRAAWVALCPVCQARVRLSVARRFRSRAIVLSILMIGNALVSTLASETTMAPITAAGGIGFCVLLAYIPVWLRMRQLHAALRTEHRGEIAHECGSRALSLRTPPG